MQGAHHRRPYCDELIVTPCRGLTKDEGDWSICFSIPADTKACTCSSKPPTPPPQAFPAEVEKHGIAHSVTIFDDVLVPWDRVFLDQDPAWAAARVLFALYHRHSYTGCKPAYTDVLMALQR